MHLRSVQIQNYWSLEDIMLGNLVRFNVLTGRNNVGKSSIFRALRDLPVVISGESINWIEAATQRHTDRVVGFELVFPLRDRERADLIDLLLIAE